jgi:hypothetical protein
MHVFYFNYRYTVKSMHLFKCVNTNCFSNLKYRYVVKSMHLFDLNYRYVIKSIHLFIKCVSSDCCFDLHYIGMSYKACVYLLIFRPSLFGYVMQRMLLLSVWVQINMLIVFVGMLQIHAFI